MRTFLSILVLLFCSGCSNQEQKPVSQNSIIAVAGSNEYVSPPEHTATSDTDSQEYMGERLKPIRANTLRINSITEWSAVDTRNVDETAEGGYAEYYFLKDTLLKIRAFHFAETGKIIRSFYTRNSELSFVLEKSYAYSRPFTWDSTSMKEKHDVEVFDGDSSEVIEDENYFESGVLIRQINNQDCGSPFAEEYLQKEQIRLKAEFQKLNERL